MKFSFVVVAFLGCLGLTACGGSVESKKISYQYSINGCDTGRHEFDSMQALCDGLKSRATNKDCAYSMRRERFERDCVGAFVETP